MLTIIAYRTHCKVNESKRSKTKKNRRTHRRHERTSMFMFHVHKHIHHPIGKVMRTGTTATSTGMSKKREKAIREREKERKIDGERITSISCMVFIRPSGRDGFALHSSALLDQPTVSRPKPESTTLRIIVECCVQKVY